MMEMHLSGISLSHDCIDVTDSLDRLMLNDADAQRQTLGLTTPMSAVHLYWCLGVGSDVTQSAVQFIQCHLSFVMLELDIRWICEDFAAQ
jgi:hypothetical protein